MGKIIMGDPNVKSIFVNIFGGIARCDHIAEAVVAGVKAVGGNDAIKPLVVRLEGTNVEAGMKIIQESGVDAFLTNDFTTGAKKAVELAKGWAVNWRGVVESEGAGVALAVLPAPCIHAVATPAQCP